MIHGVCGGVAAICSISPETVSNVCELVARDRQLTKINGGLTAHQPGGVLSDSS
jgi:hypothetical protein